MTSFAPLNRVSIDLHAHVGTPHADSLFADNRHFRRQLKTEGRALGRASRERNRTQLVALSKPLTDATLRVAAMDSARIAVQAVSALPIARPWMDGELASRYVAAANEAVAEHCRQAPQRLLPVMTVTLHHPRLARQQLVDADEAGAVAVQISTIAAEDRELDHPDHEEFWSEAEHRGIPIMIHPWGCSLGERLDIGYMFNHVGNPTETSVALSRLIFGGVFDRHPALRVWAAHGGGWLPSYSARADHAWHHRPDARTCQHPPTWYLRRMWFDSLVYTDSALRHLVDQVGPTRVTIGTDYPFDMGIDDPVHRVETAFDNPDIRARILRANALEFLGPRVDA